MSFGRRLACSGLIFFLAGCGPRTSTEINPLKGDDVILAFGDSLTQGIGAGKGQDYPSRLEKLIKRKVINAGISGEVTADGLKRLPGVLDRHKPAMLLLCHGANDLLLKLPDEQTKGNLKQMIRLAHQRNMSVILIGAPRPSLVPRDADFYADIAEEFDLTYIDNMFSDILTKPGLKADHIHPNAEGYTRVAEKTASTLRGLGAV